MASRRYFLTSLLPLVALSSLLLHGMLLGKQVLGGQSTQPRSGRALQAATMPQQQEQQSSIKMLVAAQSAGSSGISPPAQSVPQQKPLYFSPKLYSTFTCTGVKWGEASARAACQHCRTCRFDNVWLNHTSLQIQYFQDPEDKGPLFYDFSGQPHWSFPPDFINTGHVHIAPGKLDWAPSAVRRPRPAEASTSASPVAVLASFNDFASNFGHALYDFLLPVFNQMQLLGLYHPNFQLLLAKHQGANPAIASVFLSPKDPQRSLLSLISRQPARTLPEVAKQAAPRQRHTCWPSLVAGAGSLHTPAQRVRALPFRTAAFENLGVPSQPSDRNSPLVTMLKKKGKRVLENAGEVVAHLEAVFPWARFNTLDGEAVATMSIREQLQAMSETSVLITPCGGTGTVLTFLPPGATAIVMNYWVPSRNASVQMESLYYWNIEYLDLDYFSVLPEDYAGTSDRPQCEKPPSDEHYSKLGPFVDCNVRIHNLQRIEHSVGTALRKWAMQHDQQLPPIQRQS